MGQRRTGKCGRRLQSRNPGHHVDIDVGPAGLGFPIQQLENQCRHGVDAGVTAGDQGNGVPCCRPLQSQASTLDFVTQRQPEAVLALDPRTQQVEVEPVSHEFFRSLQCGVG